MARATTEHMQTLGLCMRGCRRFFTARGLDWSDVRRRGVDTRWLRATGDALAIRLADHAERQG